MKIIRKQLEDMENGNFTKEDIENAKKGIISTIKTIDNEQDTGITYCFGQELTNYKTTLEEYIQKIQKIQYISRLTLPRYLIIIQYRLFHI